jgi:hypothetical protein
MRGADYGFEMDESPGGRPRTRASPMSSPASRSLAECLHKSQRRSLSVRPLRILASSNYTSG